MKTFSKLIACGMFGLALAGCDVEKTEEGEMPSVDVQAEEGELPSYDVETPDVNVQSEERTVTVPDVDVQTEERQVEVPDVNVEMPEDDEQAPAQPSTNP